MARIFEPSMDGYAGGMAVYKAAFPEAGIDGAAALHVADLLARVNPADAKLAALQAAIQALAFEMRQSLGPSWPPARVRGEAVKEWADRLTQLSETK